jgi:hypothetical protein
MACPYGMKPNSTHTGCFPINSPKPASPGPGLLESTPGLGTQGPSPTGTPLGGAPSGGSRGPAGIR